MQYIYIYIYIYILLVIIQLEDFSLHFCKGTRDKN